MFNLLITQHRPGGPRKKTPLYYPEIILREKLQTWQSTALLSFKEELADFIARIDGKPGGPLADGFAGLRALEIAAAVRSSTQRKEVVHLPSLGDM